MKTLLINKMPAQEYEEEMVKHDSIDFNQDIFKEVKARPTEWDQARQKKHNFPFFPAAIADRSSNGRRLNSSSSSSSC